VRAPGSSLTEVTHRPNPSILHIPRPSTNKATIHGRNLLTIRFRRLFPSVESTYFRAIKKRGESATRRTAPSRGSPPVQARQRRRSRGSVHQREAVLSRDVPRSSERKELRIVGDEVREEERERERERERVEKEKERGNVSRRSMEHRRGRSRSSATSAREVGQSRETAFNL